LGSLIDSQNRGCAGVLAPYLRPPWVPERGL